MFQFLSLNPEFFGLEISDFSIKAIFLKKRGNILKSINFSETKIPQGIVQEGEIKDEEKLANLIKETIKRGKINTKYVVASIPENKVFLEIIQMPKLNEEELRSAILYEAENYIPLPLEEIILDFQIIGPVYEDSQKLNVLLIACPKKIANSYLTTLKLAELFPLAFEPESFAITRALIEKGKDQPPVLLIDFGATKSTFIISSGNLPKCSFTSPLSANTLTQVLSKTLNISFEEAEKSKIQWGLEEKIKMEIRDHETILIHERGKIFEALIPPLVDFAQQIERYLYYWETHTAYHTSSAEKKISKVILSGGGASLKGLKDFLSLELKLPVELGNPWVNITKDPPTKLKNFNSLEYTVTLGLAQRVINL
jgi:type IV pilus assembly protein PilM